MKVTYCTPSVKVLTIQTKERVLLSSTETLEDGGDIFAPES